LLLYTYLKPKNEFGQNPEDLGDGFIKAIIACFWILSVFTMFDVLYILQIVLRIMQRLRVLHGQKVHTNMLFRLLCLKFTISYYIILYVYIFPICLCVFWVEENLCTYFYCGYFYLATGDLDINCLFDGV
jgi:hypothetical protein